MADNSEKIKELEAIQDAGVTSTSVDGISASFDPAAIQRRKLELQRSDDVQKAKRPRVASINLSGSF